MRAVRSLLLPPSGLYGGIIRLRNAWYDRMPGAVRRAGVPVISVGNITVGGTGKTPFVIELVRRIQALGRRPAILTRGYKAAPGDTADEVLEFEAALGHVPVVVNADRVAGAASAVRDHGANCLVLDDGFQHRRLGRDLDLVLIDALDPWGGDAILPAGRLREPLDGLRRADVLVVTRANQVDARALSAIRRALENRVPGHAIVEIGAFPDALIRGNGRSDDIEALAQKRVLAVSGIGNPESFRRLVESLGVTSCERCDLPDHYRYTAPAAERIARLAARRGADPVVTTRKDWVKLQPLWPADAVELVRLDMRVEVLSGEDVLDARLRAAVESFT